jgi:putative thioredoxin
LLGAQRLIGGDAANGLEQFIEMLRRNRGFENGLPKQALIEAFRTIEDADLVGVYRRKMASLLF